MTLTGEWVMFADTINLRAMYLASGAANVNLYMYAEILSILRLGIRASALDFTEVT